MNNIKLSITLHKGNTTMKIFNIQMSNITIESIVNFINNSAIFNTVSIILGIISFLQEFLERYREKAWRKMLLESVFLFVAAVVLYKINNWFFAIFIVSLFVLGMTFYRRINQSKQIKANINDKPDSQINDLLTDSNEKDYPPKMLEFPQSAFKNAEQCLAEKRPKEAIRYLNKCKEKEKNQVRFATRYADALIMLNNYSGALAKLNSLPDWQLKKKKRYKSVMIRMAACYHSLNKYVEELNCYDKIIASNYKPQKYYFYRGKVKVRLLEIYPYVKSAEQVVCQTYGLKKDFIMSAITDFDKALTYGDKYKAEALSYKGSCYFYLSDYQKALDLLYESVDLKDDLGNNYVYFGLYYYENENIETAETYLEKGISLNTDNEVPYLYLARINYKNGIYDKAILYAASALSLLPLIDECHGIQGNCYKKKNMYVEAITCYTRAIELKSKAQYFQSRALCYFNKSSPNYEKAYNDILEALTLKDTDSNRIDAILYKAKIDCKNGHQMEINELKNLIHPYIKQTNYYNVIGLIFDSYDYSDEAEEYYRKAIENDTTDDVPHYNLSLLLRNTGRLEEAVEQVTDAIAINPMEMKHFTHLEDCYRDLDDTYNEISAHNKIKQLKRKYLIVNKKNGDAVYQVNKYDAAENYYQLALSYIADDPATLNNLACTFYYQERYEQAIEALENAIAQDTTYYLAYFNLGNCYLRMGNTMKNKNLARVKYQKAQQLSDQFQPAIQMLASMNPSNIRMLIDVE